MKFKFLFGLMLSASVLTAQEQAKCPLTDFQELTDTKPINNTAWDKLGNKVDISWASTDVRYSKTNVPQVKVAKSMNLTAWKGERVNAQALVWTGKNIEDMTVKASDLRGPSGSIIPASVIKTDFVRYVMTDQLNNGGGGCGHRPDPTQFDSSLVADIIDVVKVRDIAQRTTQPVWVNVWVPADVKAGNYKGSVTFSSKETGDVTLALDVKVLNRTLPAPSDWAFHLDLWQNPFSEARYNDVPLWSEAHFEAMRPTMQMLANAGQKVITTTLLHKAWGGQTEDFFETMVTRTKKLDGTWAFDYAIFDKWVEYMMSLGIDKQINCYSLIPWKLSFQYFDQATNSLQYIDTKPGEPEYDAYWKPFIADFAKHLREKGWFDIAVMSMDERPVPAMQAAIKTIKDVEPEFKISLAGWYHPEIEADLYDYCLAYTFNVPADVKAAREKAGKKTTVYTCCTESFPNTFTFSDPAESTWLGWHAMSGNYDGYLRWAYNSWTKEPLQDSRFRTWAAGDCYLVYPNGRSSIRFERMIEGIQDYEKMRILKEEFKAKNQTGKLKQLDKLVSQFTVDGAAGGDAATKINNARKALNQF